MVNKTDIITDEDLIKLYYDDKLSLRNICKKYNINKSNYPKLSKRLKKIGYILRKNKPRKRLNMPEQKIISLYNSGKSMRDIVKELNNEFGINLISEVLKDNNVLIHNNSGKFNKNWNGGKFKSNYGYIKILDKNNNKADVNGYVLEHIKNYENETGYSLKENEVLHHIDLDKENNIISNLIKLNRKEHSQLHNDLNKIISILIKEKIILFKNGKYDINYNMIAKERIENEN